MNSSSGIAGRLDDVLGEYRALERRIIGPLSTSGVGIDAWRVLRLVQNNEGVSMKEVLDATNLPPASATRAVDSLVSLGYAFRRSHELDRRSVQVMVTEAGVATLARIETALEAEFSGQLDKPSHLHVTD